MKKLCVDQKKSVVEKLAALFKDLLPQDIDDVVAQAKDQASAQVLEDRKRYLGQLFDSQMRTLEDRGCPKAIIEMLQKKRDEVLARATKMEIPEGNIPFLPVILRSYLGIYGLMPMVRNGDKAGFTYLDPNEIFDNESAPKEPYFIYDVEDGRATLGKSPEKAEEIIKGQSRLCHIPDEDIALAIYTNVLSDHYLWSTGSRYKDANDVPLVCLGDGRPRLSWGSADDSHVRWGSASCRSRE